MVPVKTLEVEFKVSALEYVPDSPADCKTPAPLIIEVLPTAMMESK